ncbi:HNH endonuclease [Burkholderia cenocepacia]|uniref:HNH endonuclease n=1 Tax=Burkholderia cenocepacia TaxID=95486 RepID=UPI002AB79404|nr:HNH endonuclease [Burkholderia cenocepacia]
MKTTDKSAEALTASAHVFEFYRFLFTYNPETGVLIRKKTPDSHGGFRDCHHIVQSTNGKGYLVVRVNGHNRRVHRLVWEIHYSVDAPPVMDHENHVRGDNRIANLRRATLCSNNQNAMRKPGSTCPYRGVRYERHIGKYRAQITVGGKYINLGFHTDPEICAHRYNRAAIELHGEFAILNAVSGVHDE